MKKSKVFILEVESCILGDLKYNKAEYDIYRHINNIKRINNYNFNIDLLRPGLLDFIKFIKKKYNAEIYIVSNSDPCWINNIVGPFIQKHFKVNKPYFTNADFIDNNFPLDTIIKNVIKNNNFTCISSYQFSEQHKDKQLIIPEYNNLQYINIYDNMISHFGKDIFNNEDIQKNYIRIINDLLPGRLFSNENIKDPMFFKLVELLHMRYVEVNNVKDDNYFPTLIEKLKDKTIANIIN